MHRERHVGGDALEHLEILLGHRRRPGLGVDVDQPQHRLPGDHRRHHQRARAVPAAQAAAAVRVGDHRPASHQHLLAQRPGDDELGVAGPLAHGHGLDRELLVDADDRDHGPVGVAEEVEHRGQDLVQHGALVHGAAGRLPHR